MAILTLDQVVSGMKPPEEFLKIGTAMKGAGILHSLIYATGRPGAAVAPSPGLAGAALTTYAGQLPWTNPAGGLSSYLGRLAAGSTATGTLILADRLWHNSGIAVTTLTAQTVNSLAWPARDNAGRVNGVGVMVGLEVSTATTNAGAVLNTTLGYTNSLGVASQVGTMASFPATANAGTFVPFQLAAGDSGVQSIQSVTLGTSYAAGAVSLVAYRTLARVGIGLANVDQAVDALTAGMPQLYDNTVPFLLWLPTAGAAVTVGGQLAITQG